MRIIFFGATELGYQCCQQLIRMGEQVVGIFSIPQEFQISYSATPVRNVTFHSFESLAQEHSIPLVYVTGKMGSSQYVEALKTWKPDFGLAIGWYYMIPRKIRAIFPQGVAGVHASLLPAYRGGAPLVWALINGERQAGVSLFYFDDGVDTGDIIAQQEIPIAAEDTIREVYEKATYASLELLRTHIPLLREGTAPRLPQDHSKASQFPQRTPEDGLIDWKKLTARQVYNWVRAQTHPYPGAFTYLSGKKVVIYRATLSDVPVHTITPGLIITDLPDHPDAFGVCCADGSMVHVQEISLAGEKTMSGAAFVATQSIETGTRFDNSGPKE